MVKNKRFFILFSLLSFFSCKAMSDLTEKNNIYIMNSLFEKDPKKQISRFIFGSCFSLVSKGVMSLVYKACPEGMRSWIDDVQFSLLFSVKGKELKLSHDMYMSLFALYVVSKINNNGPYKLEMLLGFFVAGPLIIKTYQYATQAKNQNSQK